MIRWMIVLFVASNLIVSAAQAQDRWLHINGISWHERSGYNGENWGLGIEVQNSPKWSTAVGFYQNSLNRQTWYALSKYHWWRYGTWTANINMGAATGYQIHPIVPVVLPELCMDWLCFLVVPQLGANTTAALAAYIRIAF